MFSTEELLFVFDDPLLLLFSSFWLSVFELSDLFVVSCEAPFVVAEVCEEACDSCGKACCDSTVAEVAEAVEAVAE